MDGVIDITEVPEDEEPEEERIGRVIGAKLRQIRLRKQLSLQDVEAATRNEFKASVLGAYERGERKLTVHRLLGLLEFYGVGLAEVIDQQPPAHYELTVRFQARPNVADMIPARLQAALADAGATRIGVSAA